MNNAPMIRGIVFSGSVTKRSHALAERKADQQRGTGDSSGVFEGREAGKTRHKANRLLTPPLGQSREGRLSCNSWKLTAVTGLTLTALPLNDLMLSSAASSVPIPNTSLAAKNGAAHSTSGYLTARTRKSAARVAFAKGRAIPAKPGKTAKVDFWWAARTHPKRALVFALQRSRMVTIKRNERRESAFIAAHFRGGK
jgi:hypothetical protein